MAEGPIVNKEVKWLKALRKNELDEKLAEGPKKNQLMNIINGLRPKD